jgi:bacterioferritin
MTLTADYKKSLIDVATIRKQANESLLEGAVTKDYPLDLQESIKLMNDALASEILCVLRYRHHQIIAKGIDWPQVAAQFTEHAIAEQEHMLLIAERINQLGGDPDFNPTTIATRSATEYGSSGGNVQLNQLIREDLVAERIAIEVYRRLVEHFGQADPTSRRMFEKILEDEEEHANDLADLLAVMGTKATPH